MNISPCTTAEAQGFEYISDFLYPNDQLDEQALHLFLSIYLKPVEGYARSGPAEQYQTQTMGLLLRLIDVTTPLWPEAFQTWYAASRMTNETVVSTWFSFLDDAHKEATKTEMLRMLAGAPSIDIRVALMMDGAEHYKELPIKTFIGKSLLRVKAASFVKALKPRVSQMPMVLRMAKELSTTEPEFKGLAEAITLGVFVQRMSEKPSASNPQREYSAGEAFLLVLDHGAVPASDAFVAAAKSRFKGASLLPDMMQFVSWALETDPSKNWMPRLPSDTERNFSTDLMASLINDIEKQATATNNFDSSMVKVHALASEDMKAKILQWFIRRVAYHAEKQSSSGDSVMSTPAFTYMLDHMAPLELHSQLWQEWSVANKKSSIIELVQGVVENGGHGYGVSQSYYARMREHVSTDLVVSMLFKRAEHVFNRANTATTTKFYRNENEIEKNEKIDQAWGGNMEQFFANTRRLMTEDIRENQSFKQLVAATSMAYLLHGSSLRDSVQFETHNGIFVNLLAEPLPLLRSMYPEHTIALNTLRKDILSGLSKAKAPQSSYHRALYAVLGRALYTEASVSADAVQGMVEAMGVTPLVYFQACAMKTDVHFEVSGDIFELDLS